MAPEERWRRDLEERVGHWRPLLSSPVTIPGCCGGAEAAGPAGGAGAAPEGASVWRRRRAGGVGWGGSKGGWEARRAQANVGLVACKTCE